MMTITYMRDNYFSGAGVPPVVNGVPSPNFFHCESNCINNFLGQTLEYVRLKKNMRKSHVREEIEDRLKKDSPDAEFPHERLDCIFNTNQNNYPRVTEAEMDKVLDFITDYKTEDGSINLQGKKSYIKALCLRDSEIEHDPLLESLRNSFNKAQDGPPRDTEFVMFGSKHAVEKILKEITQLPVRRDDEFNIMPG